MTTSKEILYLRLVGPTYLMHAYWVGLGQVFLLIYPLFKTLFFNFHPIIQEKITYYSQKITDFS